MKKKTLRNTLIVEWKGCQYKVMELCVILRMFDKTSKNYFLFNLYYVHMHIYMYMHALNEVKPFWMTMFPTSVIDHLRILPVSSIKNLFLVVHMVCSSDSPNIIVYHCNLG